MNGYNNSEFIISFSLPHSTPCSFQAHVSTPNPAMTHAEPETRSLTIFCKLALKYRETTMPSKLTFTLTEDELAEIERALLHRLGYVFRRVPERSHPTSSGLRRSPSNTPGLSPCHSDSVRCIRGRSRNELATHRRSWSSSRPPALVVKSVRGARIC
jgi:hypothetical protein